MNFNNKQIEAIESTNNVTVVIAGAGSGKTAVLVKRIEKLIHNGIKPYNILAITFTNKAAKEMKQRLVDSVGIYAYDTHIMTFHAMSVKIIRENLNKLKYYEAGFLIIDDDDKKSIIKNIIKDLNLGEEFKVTDVMYSIGSAKSRALTYQNVENLIDREMLVIYDKYKEYLHQNNAMDFDDLLLLCYELLKVQEVRAKYQSLFKYISVDEFQDTSLLQSEILKKLKSKENNLFIVGDIDQSIYTWRGAVVENLLNITDDYEDAKTVKLEQNYRSTSAILDAANKLIANNKKRIDKNLWTENKAGNKIEYYHLDTNIDEAELVVREINSVVDYGGTYDDFAVLYRYNYQSRKIEETLMKNKIPYILYGGVRFYQRLEIKDTLAYIRLLINPNDNISLLRIINTPKRKAGEKTIDRLRNYAYENQISIFQAIEEIGSKALLDLTKLIQDYKEIIQEADSEKFSLQFDEFIKEIKYEEYLLTQYDKFNVEDRMSNIRELKESLMEELDRSGNIVEYINEINLYDNEDNLDTDAVILSTIHGSKGLEFDTVFMIGMIEGRFPKEAAAYIDDEMEEERRLAYVGITRAKRKLYLTSVAYDFKYMPQDPSRFIEEIGLQGEEENWNNFIF